MESRLEFTMCRLCLCESENFIDIFKENELFGYVAAEVIKDLIQFQVSETDGYPHVVCTTCLGKLTDFKQFKEQCENSRDIYNNVFVSDESHAEHAIDIVELMPVKLEPKDPLDTQEGAQKEIRKCCIGLTSQEHLPLFRKRTHRESYGPSESDVTDNEEPLLKREENVAVDGDSCDNIKSSGSAEDEVERMDIEVGTECKYEDDTNGVESCVEDLKRETTEGREEVDFVGTSVDATLEERQYFRCHDCGNEFVAKDVLIRHLGVHGYFVNMENSGEERDVQVNTDVKRNTNDVLKKGSKRKKSDEGKGDEGVRKFACDVCGQRVNCLSHMKIHLRVHTGEKPFACSICGKRFSCSSVLGRHKLTHTGDKPYTCDVCGMRFAVKSYLVSHRRIHTGEKPFVCKVCCKGFRQKSHLINHNRIHSGEKPYKCEVCGKEFSQSSTCTNHMRVHSGEKPYKCDICGRRFRDVGIRKRHMLIHCGDKAFKCQICYKKFLQSDSLTKHMRVHSGEKPYKCGECKKCFGQSSHLRRHLKIHWNKR